MDNKDRIIEGAAELFRKFGIRSVTMDSIAGELGISKRTIYEIFSDKDELLAGVLNWMTIRQREFLKRILKESENPIEAIFRVLEFNRNHFESMSPAFQADVKKFILGLSSKKYKCDLPDYRNHQEIIEKGIKDGYFRKDVNPDLANRCLYYLGTSIMDYELYPYELFSRNDVIRNTFINFLRGISSVKGLELIDKLEANFIRIL
ncbi:MAG TPA: TetR/AcrR family transcriptional regulator [Bacteroidales bacterium]|nr:TetR/AcrR family transcriptional regulator [Bacteroidales bacterium]